MFGTWPPWEKSYKRVARRQAASNAGHQVVHSVLDDLRSVDL